MWKFQICYNLKTPHERQKGSLVVEGHIYSRCGQKHSYNPVYLLLKILLQSIPIQRAWDKTEWHHAIYSHISMEDNESTAIPSPILSGLHLRDPWSGSEGSRVQNLDKTSWLLFLLLSSFIHPFLPSQRRTQKWVRVKTWYFKCRHAKCSGCIAALAYGYRQLNKIIA